MSKFKFKHLVRIDGVPTFVQLPKNGKRHLRAKMKRARHVRRMQRKAGQ